ncbi:carboxymuconolactone decarboxylase family protein [Dyella sp. 20L07]|uniref:carboxymuconolactone decarboxylase family protein n=1 Tax=Dyella sp. 20L07 TaxID=3384240 RepID=UPI003D2A9CEF
MSPRLSFYKYANAIKPLIDLDKYVRQSGLEHSLIELVLLRVSQINGCAYCLDMHSKDARAAGETEQRLYLLQAWREAPFYNTRECAALAWAEAVTQLGEHGVSDAVYDQASAAFSEEELVNLNMVVVMINGWNRMAIPFRSVPGHYKPAVREAV